MSQDDQVVSVRLRRKNTGTPWGFRMHGGAEYAKQIFIQHVNPKSLAYRQGLRVDDRLLAVGNAPTHSLTHEQVKMEIIRAGNELDFVVQRNMAAAGQDQQDSHPARTIRQQHQPQYDEPEEEPSQYRGYTNPKVQSRSFKMLQESLNYTEAGEEGIIVPSGQTPGEGVVLRAYTEGKRRMEELAQISPRNFIAESPLYERGQNLLKCSEEDEEIIAKLNCSWKSKEPKVAKAKSYTPGSSSSNTQNTQDSQSVDLSGSSVLAPAAAQQTYLQQAHAHYGDQQPPTIQVAVAQQPVQPIVIQTVQTSVQQPAHAQTQKAPRRRERKRQPKEQQTVTQKIQSPVSPAQSSGFIPTTDTVSSVAEELNLKHESTVERSEVEQKAPKQHVKMEIVNVQSTNKSFESKVSQKQEANLKQASTVERTEVEQKAPQQQVKIETVVMQPSTKSVESEVSKKQELNLKHASTVERSEVEHKAPQQQVKTETVDVQPSVESTVSQQQEVSVVSKQPEQPEKIPTVNKPQPAEIAQTETVIVKPTEPKNEDDKPPLDSVDATVEPSADVIREYGERMAETVISESIQDASQGIKDTIDGSSVTKSKPAEKAESEQSTSTSAEEKSVEKVEKLESKATIKEHEQKAEDVQSVEILSDEKVEKSEPEVSIKEEEQKADAGKSNTEPNVNESDSTSQLTLEEATTEQVVSVESSQSEVVVENTSIKKDEQPTEAVNVNKSDSKSAVEEASTEKIVSVESSQSEVVVETTSITEEKQSTEVVNVSLQEVSNEETTVGESTKATIEDTEASVESSSNVEISMALEETSSDDTVIAVDISADAGVEETVEISMGESEASFVVGGEEESSFVFEVQEESQDLSAVAQSETFDISVSQDADETANITLDLSANVTVEASEPVEGENTEVSVSLESNETVETVIVEEKKKADEKQPPTKDDSKSEQTADKKPLAKTDNGNKNSAPPKKAKFVDSQGGVSARLARFNLKKK